ncbi:MAG: hypothetical protein H7263_06930 [Candidatus Sericytochromatia bacterium]|nr:hypothetical protein [Candidatus Sericytochromatia bacterium]
MSGLTFNSGLVAKSYDTNNDGIVSDNLKVRQDQKTISALGGSDKVSVGQLANAIGNNSVIVKNGEIFAPANAIKIPVMYQDIQAVHDVASNALSNTSSWNHTYIPSYPRESDFQGPAQYKEAVSNYNSAVRSYRADIKTDRAVLVNALNNISYTTNNPQIKNMVNTAIRNTAMNDILGMVVNERNNTVIMEDRNSLRSALTSISDMTQFTQPSKNIGIVNQEIKNANDNLVTEETNIKTKLPAAVAQTEKEISDVKAHAWFFKGTRVEGKENDIKEIKGYSTVSGVSGLTQLARANYELGVSVLDGFSIEDARGISQSTLQNERQVNQIGEKAEREAKKIDKMTK